MKNLILSFVYALGRFGLGLLIHPHQTMQILVKQKLFIWMSFLPSILLVLLMIIFKVLAYLLMLVGFGGLTQIANTAFFNFVRIWILYFFMYWQIMLVYFLTRFIWAFYRK